MIQNCKKETNYTNKNANKYKMLINNYYYQTNNIINLNKNMKKM